MATQNHTKYLLFNLIFRKYGFEVITLADIREGSAPVAEVGETPLENALAKARQYHSRHYPWVFGDDAGLEIDALNGEPGLEARRWGGQFSDQVDDETWLNYLLERMKKVPLDQRTASFFAAWVIIAPDKSEYVRKVRFPFKIATEQIRPISPGSPISAVRMGQEGDIEERSKEIAQELERWGILATLLDRFPE